MGCLAEIRYLGYRFCFTRAPCRVAGRLLWAKDLLRKEKPQGPRRARVCITESKVQKLLQILLRMPNRSRQRQLGEIMREDAVDVVQIGGGD